MTLEQAIAALTRAGFDVNAATLCDALWLATQAGITIDTAPLAIEPNGSTMPAGEPRSLTNRFEPGSRAETARSTQGARRAEQTSAYQEGGELTGDIVRASPIRVPAGAALPGRLPLLRSMRPFTERWPSQRVEELDEEATVNATAEQAGRLSIVFRRRPERWFDAALVVDDSPSMDIWHDTLIEFERLLQETGAFRDVRTWRLTFSAAQQAAGSSGVEPELRSASGGRVSAAGLASRRTRRLIFLATHGISPRWSDASMGSLLDTWSLEASVVILHMLPPELWAKTPLGEPGGLIYALAPGARTAELAFARFTWESLDDGRPAVPIPVIPLEREASTNWARMQMARGRRSPAMLVTMEAPSAPAILDDDPMPGDRELVMLFRSHGSSEAFRLAVYLSAGPFTLPVARLIQAAKLGASARQSQLAELFLSGLVRRNTPLGAPVHPDWVQYEITESARPLLFRSLTEEDAQSVLDTLQAHVGRFLEQTYGKPADFRALVRDPEGTASLPAWAQPFATIGTALIRLQSARVESDAPPSTGDASSVAEPALEERTRVGRGEDGDTYVTTLARTFGELPRTDVPWLTDLRVLWVTETTERDDTVQRRLRSLGASVHWELRLGIQQIRNGPFDILVGEIGPSNSDRTIELFRALGRLSEVVIAYAPDLTPRERELLAGWGAFDATDSRAELLALVMAAADRTRARRFIEAYNAALSMSTELRPLIQPLLNKLPQEVARGVETVTSAIPMKWTILATFLQAVTQASTVEVYLVGETSLEKVAYHTTAQDLARGSRSPSDLVGTASRTHETQWTPDVSKGREQSPPPDAIGSELALPAFRGRLVVNIRDVRINAYSSAQIRWLAELVRAYQFFDVESLVALQPRSVLVAGTGKYELSPRELWVSEAIGQMLAEAGHRLVTGGWSGVDHVVAREYATHLKARGLDVSEYLTQVVSKRRGAAYPEGRIVTVSTVANDFDEEISHAEVVVLIGGLGGTYEMFRRASRREIPVLPLPGTGGDAERVFEELDSPDLQSLSLDVNSPWDAHRLADRLRRLLADDDVFDRLPAPTFDEPVTSDVPPTEPASDGHDIHSLFGPFQNIEFNDPEAPVIPPWTLMDRSARAALLEQLHPIDGEYAVSLETTQVLQTRLPFYDGVPLVRVRDMRWKPRLCIYYLSHEDNLFRLNGTSPPLHEVNAKAGIALTSENVLDYIRFFDFFVRGEKGPFYVLERQDDPLFDETPDETTRSLVNSTARAARFLGMDQNGHFLADAVISYSNELYISNFAVQPTGLVEMVDDKPIAAKLTVRIAAPIS